jgi:hypothetical protein
MRAQLQRRCVKEYFEIASGLIGDQSEHCRWQATIVVGEFIPVFPDRVWDIIVEWCPTKDADLKDALATVLLEHLLAFEFDVYFARVVARARRGDKAIIDLLSRCWPFGRAEKNWNRVRRLLRKHGEETKLPWE